MYEDVADDPEGIGERHRVLIRVLVILSVRQEEASAPARRSRVDGVFTGVVLTIEQHHHRTVGVGDHSKRSPG